MSQYHIHIDRSARAFVSGILDVYVVTKGHRGGVLQLTDDGRENWVFSDEGAHYEGPPTFSIPEHLATDLAAAILDIAPASREQGKALEDARAVRDRLLTMVESVVRNAVVRNN